MEPIQSRNNIITQWNLVIIRYFNIHLSTRRWKKKIQLIPTVKIHTCHYWSKTIHQIDGESVFDKDNWSSSEKFSSSSKSECIYLSDFNEDIIAMPSDAHLILKINQKSSNGFPIGLWYSSPQRVFSFHNIIPVKFSTQHTVTQYPTIVTPSK